MALSPKIELRTAQTVVMTPQLQQAIKLLQLSNLELSAYVEQQLESNPVLEREEAPEEPVPTERWDGEEVEFDGEPEDKVAIELDRVDLESSRGVDGEDAPLDTAFENVFDDDGPARTPAEAGEQAAWSELRGAGGSFAEDDGPRELALSRSVSLKEHLLAQLGVALSEPAERLIGAHLVECLDESGYLAEGIDEIADKLGAAPARVAAVLTRLQGLDPPGVGARNLAECLALQLKELDRLDPAMQTLLDNLELLAAHDLARLMRLCRIDAEDLSEMIAEIRALNPKPGLAYDDEVAQPVVPDVFVRRDGDGNWQLELNGQTLPRLLVNRRYAELVEGRGAAREAKAYVGECLANANWLIKSLDQRARTILRVAGEIVRQQGDFLNRGVRYLKPLNLRAIAEAVEMHESTVSRVTSNKYMATPRGIFELKYFFTSAIASAEGGEAHSAEAVKHRLRLLIEAEAPKAILSDDRLVELLHDDGVEIARRTVAKYREAMGIPSSVQRRRQKRAG